MPAADDFDIRTVHGVIDACRRGAKLEAQHSFLVFIRDGLNRTIEQLEHAIAKERGKTPPPPTPPPRRISQTLPNATAPTTRHDMRPLVAEAEAQRELEQRDTPEAFERPAIRNTHPDRER